MFHGLSNPQWLLNIVPSLFQTDQMSPQMVEERMEGADPCHDYNEEGPGPEGCWWHERRESALWSVRIYRVIYMWELREYIYIYREELIQILQQEPKER